MLKMSNSFVIRMSLWFLLILYLICDFYFFNGPLKRELRSMFPTSSDKVTQAMEEGICARVYNAPIYLTQVDRRVQEKLYRTGRDMTKVSEQELHLLRWEAMDILLSESLLRIKTKVNAQEVEVSKEEIDAELAHFKNRFASVKNLKKSMQAQGIESEKELRFRIAARIQQEKYLQSKIQTSIATSEDEARAWYKENTKAVTVPERRKVRHIFLPTLDHPSEKAKAVLTKKLQEITEKTADFASVARTISEDPRSQKVGGELGWLTKERLPKDFATAVFSAKLNDPSLVRTKLGWHIIEVTGVKSAEVLPFDQVKKEIMSSLSDSKRKDSIQRYRQQLRAREQKHIEIYPAVLKSKKS